MTDLQSTSVVDATIWQNRPSLNSGDTNWIQVRTGDVRGLVRPNLVNILGRTVIEARLVGRVGPGWVAQQLSFAPATEKWSEGRVTWANQPAVDTTAYVFVDTPAMPDGGIVEVPVTAHLQDVADGVPWYGWRVGTDNASNGQRFYAKDSGEPAWELYYTLSDDPEQPSDLRPNGGAVSTATPIVAWDFLDLGGESTEQTDSRVQVWTPAVVGDEPDEDTVPTFDTGWVANPDPQYDLATTTHVPAGAGPHYWRVQVRDGDGGTSEWSDWAEYTVAPLPVLVIDTPTGPVGDPMVTVMAHLTGGTVENWKVRVTGEDRADVRYGTGMRTGAVEVTIPERNRHKQRVIREDKPGWIHVRVWDDVDRAVAVGEQVYVEEWIAVDFTDSATIIAPTDLTVVPYADGDPRMVWSWSSTDTTPDAWLIQVDGNTVERIEGTELDPVAGRYTWTDLGHVAPLRPHELAVKATRGKDRSVAATVPSQAHVVEGVWLIPDHDSKPIMLVGTAVSGFATSDHVATYQPLGAEPVDIVYGWVGRVGEFEGWVDDRQNVWAMVDRINALRTHRNRYARMVWGAQSITVRVKDPDATSSDDILPENLEHVVRFGFVEVPED